MISASNLSRLQSFELARLTWQACYCSSEQDKPEEVVEGPAPGAAADGAPEETKGMSPRWSDGRIYLGLPFDTSPSDG